MVVPAPAPAAPIPAEPEEAPEAPEQPEMGSGGVPLTYIVQEGDTLINLAERFYGDYKKWREIYSLNQDRIGRGGPLKPGQILIMPRK